MFRRGFFLILLVFTVIPVFSETEKNALTLYKNKNYSEAVDVCLSELDNYHSSEFSKRMDSYTVLLWSLIKLERYAEAVKYGMEVYNITDKDWRIIESLGEAHYYLGNNNESLFFLERYIERQPSGGRAAKVYYLMGHLFIRMEEYNRADIALSMAVYLKQQDAKWWTRLGYARQQAKDYQRAKDAYNEALSLNPTLTEAQRGIDKINKTLGL